MTFPAGAWFEAVGKHLQPSPKIQKELEDNIRPQVEALRKAFLDNEKKKPGC